MGRLLMSKWLRAKGVSTWQASDWNELTQMLGRAFQETGSCGEFIDVQSQIDLFPGNTFKDIRNSQFVIVVDIGLLDLSTNIWKEQLNCLNQYTGKAKFAWILKHDTFSSVKSELRRRGHLLMVNRPLYKSKMIQILEAVINDRNIELQKECESASSSSTTLAGDMHECLEIDPAQYEGSSSEDSDKGDAGFLSSRSAFQIEPKKKERIGKPSFSQLTAANNYLLELDEDNLEGNSHDDQKDRNSRSSMQTLTRNCQEEGSNLHFAKNMSEQRSLEGLKILLAEDTPVLQRVASIMLEKVGARVIAVGDGLQAVNALKCSKYAEGCCPESPSKEGRTSQTPQNFPPFDLILMDCQVVTH